MKGINVKDLRRLVHESLVATELWSEAAEELIMGTVATESQLGYHLYQLAHGPARGIIQMEPYTEYSLWNNFLAYRPLLRSLIERYTGRTKPGPWLTWDLAYQIILARVKYLTVPDPLPDAHDIEAQAKYWKQWYNTPKGRGKIIDYIDAVEKYIKRYADPI